MKSASRSQGLQWELELAMQWQLGWDEVSGVRHFHQKQRKYTSGQVPEG
jgi:hypothetical protein